MLAFTLRFIKNKRYFAILAGALVIIDGLTSQHAWSGNGLPQINGKTAFGLIFCRYTKLQSLFQ